MMKAFIIALALVASVAADWTPKSVEEMKAIRTECSAGLSEENIQKMDQHEYPDVEPVRKYILCNAEKLGVFCQHEGWHTERVVRIIKAKAKTLEEAEIKEIIEKCADKNEEKSSIDVWVFRVYECFRNSKLRDSLKKED